MVLRHAFGAKYHELDHEVRMPEVLLKRQLRDGFLREVYGNSVGDDTLFLQHTYLTIIAKTIAVRVLDLDVKDAASILSGHALSNIGIHGAVESDFFDWVLQAERGRDLVMRLARQAARFRLRDLQVDVMKALYESLIDPAQRHGLGEYYTQDWLAAKVVKAAVTNPLTQRVLDPACGSGTFLFHAVRRLIDAGQDAGWEAEGILAAGIEQVRGLDVHPVAVSFVGPTSTRRTDRWSSSSCTPSFFGESVAPSRILEPTLCCAGRGAEHSRRRRRWRAWISPLGSMACRC